MGLRAWSSYHQLLRQNVHPTDMGFRVSYGHINRFASRVRLAREFEGLNLPTYAEETVLGYEALMQVFLTHSALETFPPMIGLRHVHELDDVVEPYGCDALHVELLEHDAEGAFFNFLRRHVNRSLKMHIDSFRAGELRNPCNLSAAIRHIFAHGHLTATGNGVNPKRVHALCVRLSDFLLDVLDEEFSGRIEAYPRSLV